EISRERLLEPFSKRHAQINSPFPAQHGRFQKAEIREIETIGFLSQNAQDARRKCLRFLDSVDPGGSVQQDIHCELFHSFSPNTEAMSLDVRAVPPRAALRKVPVFSGGKARKYGFPRCVTRTGCPSWAMRWYDYCA